MTTIELINPKNLKTEKFHFAETYRDAEQKAKTLNEQLNKSGNKAGRYWTVTTIQR